MKTSPLKRSSKPMRRRRRIRPVSLKTQRRLLERRKVMARVRERSKGRCEVDGCNRPAVHGHEPMRRAQGGDALDAAGVIHVCAAHHDWIHRNPKAAVEAKLLKWKFPVLSEERNRDPHAGL